MAVYVKRERVTWMQRDRWGQPKITHPMQYLIYEDGEVIKAVDLRSEADSYIAERLIDIEGRSQS